MNKLLRILLIMFTLINLNELVCAENKSVNFDYKRTKACYELQLFEECYDSVINQKGKLSTIYTSTLLENEKEKVSYKEVCARILYDNYENNDDDLQFKNKLIKFLSNLNDKILSKYDLSNRHFTLISENDIFKRSISIHKIDYKVFEIILATTKHAKRDNWHGFVLYCNENKYYELFNFDTDENSIISAFLDIDENKRDIEYALIQDVYEWVCQ